MHTLAAFYEAQDGAAALHNVAAVQDSHVRAAGDYIYVPKTMPYVIGKACLSNADTALTLARLNSPKLREICYPYIEPLVNAIVFGSPPEGILHPKCPIPLESDEALAFEINSDEAADTSKEYGLVWLADGAQAEVTGEMFQIYATTAITLSEGSWVNGNITFDVNLRVGTYAIVGMRARGDNLVAARLVFQDQTNRPGVPAVNYIGDIDHDATRFGRMGTFGTFEHLNPPTIDAMGVTDTAQYYIFDLMKIA